MRLAKKLLGFALGLAIGLLIGYGFLYLYANHQMEKRSYAPFHAVMKAAGYSVEKVDGVEAVCRNAEREIILTVEKGCKSIQVNQNTYTSNKVFSRTLNVLYVDVEYMESLLQVNIKRKKGVIPWTSTYKVIYYEDKVAGTSKEEEAEKVPLEVESEDSSGYQEVGSNSTTFHKLQSNVEKALSTSLVAHAGGGFLLTTLEDTNYMLRYTNSKEAVLTSAKNGYKMIELDFAYSGDGVLCAVHKWDSKKEKNDSAVFLENKFAGVLNKLTMEDTLEILNELPYVCMILDVRLDNETEEVTASTYSKIISMAMEIGGDSLAKRVIPQIYHPWQYDVISKIYNWGSIIFTLYKEMDMTIEEIVDFVKDKNDIQIITIPKAILDEEVIQSLHRVNKKVFTHTLNGLSSMNAWRKKGADGFYTDIITPEMYYERFGVY